MLWSDGPFQREWRYTCICSRFRCRKFMLSLSTYFLKALFVGLLWAEAVLIDGGWYVCCRNDLPEKQAGLPCKDPKNIYNTEEKAIIAQLKSSSRAVGIALFAFASLLVAVWFSLDWKRIFSICWRDSMNLKIQLHRLILEEHENMLTDKLRKVVNDQISQKLTRYVDEERWDQFFNTAHELIIKSSEDKASGPETKTSSDQPSSQNSDQDQPGTSSERSMKISGDRLPERSSSGSIQVEVQVPTETDPLILNSEDP
ncbi:uncharacterized protein LOC121650991 isoform X2 [Melanotaenia boesemani]|uniref:uncharacterized protein LOC121650991 isoform X2 n=1 Tax=Melanotaenia boesemani TaxID=1250792 RepID=UPI001C04BB5B|nr:uncharacterized protein LOC121650991 isoform X2 [Melanotaenia boesemani]